MTNKAAFAAGVIAFLVASASATNAAAQPACNDLDGLRSLFNEAYKDEQDKRYDQALEKFRNVERCKASPSVRYRIASVLEAQGKLREARDTFRNVVATGDANDPKQKPIMQSSDDRAKQLDKRIPKLVLKLPPNPPEGTTVTVDGQTVASTGTPIELDPGDHTVQASAPTAKQPFESKVKLGESGQVELQVVLEGPGQPTCAAGTTWNGKDCAPDKPPGGGEHKSNVLPYILVGGGVALIVGGIVMFVARKSDIDDINKLCPDLNACNPANKSAVDSDKSQANLFLPLGVGLEVVGIAAAGFGAYMLLKPAPTDNATPTQSPSGGLRIAPRYVRGGAILGVGTNF